MRTLEKTIPSPIDPAIALIEAALASSKVNPLIPHEDVTRRAYERIELRENGLLPALLR